ncbi:dopamine receptor 4-like [Bolinopsis microptera]|uniref:dopamine receptor 4-like n=1 Tax=Bolinopsis microptera TaxID=2820187 RepID=UPI00307A904B
MAIVASIWNLQMSSIDRYVAITRPLRYKSLITYKLSYIMIAVVWFICAVLAMFPLVGWDRYIYSNKSYSCGIDGHSNYFLCFLVLGIFVPLFVTIYSYINIGYCAIRHSLSSKQTKEMQGIAMQKQAVKKRNLRISVTVLSIIGAFIVCTLPLFVMGLLQYCGVQFRTKHLTDMFVHVLLLSNSALNPILYSFGTYQFREAFVDLIYCRTTSYQLQTRQFRARTTTRAEPANSQSQRFTDENVRAKRVVKRASSDDLTVAVDTMRKEKEGNVKEEHNAIRLSEIKSIKFGNTDEILQI